MPELTLEALAARVAALERKLASMAGGAPAEGDWRSVVGMFDGSEFMPQVLAEGRAIREADRQAAREGRAE